MLGLSTRWSGGGHPNGAPLLLLSAAWRWGCWGLAALWRNRCTGDEGWCRQVDLRPEEQTIYLLIFRDWSSSGSLSSVSLRRNNSSEPLPLKGLETTSLTCFHSFFECRRSSRPVSRCSWSCFAMVFSVAPFSDPSLSLFLNPLTSFFALVFQISPTSPCLVNSS